MSVTSPYDELTPESIKVSMLSDLQVGGADISTVRALMPTHW